VRLAARIRQFTLGAFALWLALWPAGDAITGASQVLIVAAAAAEGSASCCESAPAVAEPEARCGAAAAAVPHCAAAVSACAAVQGREPQVASCSDAQATGAGTPSPCAGNQVARCGQCQSIGGMVLFATAPPRHLPDLELVGILSAIRIVRPSRSLQPLIRPPIAELLTAI
jgi:hypothetical protein